ncbi:hypothetical protein BKI52_42245 [marine bacterium AO1-C]|nr:hypothetical protein BKI52_42245 [marine bacterium AO1-C]
MKDDKEILFRIEFTRKLTEAEQDVAIDSFIDLLETNGLLWGGGGGLTYIMGGLSHKNDDFFNETKVKNLLLRWVNQTPLAASIDFNIDFSD